MKVINGILRFFAILLLLFFVISFPIALLVRNAGEILFSPEAIVGLLEENILDSEVMATISEEAIRDVRLDRATADNPFADLFTAGMQGLDHDEWVKVIELIAPPELISETFRQVLEGYYGWIEGPPNQAAKIFIDVAPWKSNIETNAIPVLDIILTGLRSCTPEEVEVYRNISQSNEITESVPLCRPTERIYNWLLDEAHTTVPIALEQIPDRVDLGKAISTNGNNLGNAKQQLLKLKVGMRTAWIIPLIAFIIAVPMASRSVSDFFKWGGWPLLSTGVWALLIALLLLFFSESIFAGLGRLIFTEMPSALLIPLEAIISSVLGFFAKKLLFQSAILIVLGGGALFGGVMLSSDKVKQESMAVPAPVSDRPVEKPKPTSQPEEPETILEPTPKKETDGEEGEDDDSRPTGMFG